MKIGFLTHCISDVQNIKYVTVLLLETDPLTVCYSLKCPEGTFWCGKNSEISPEDKTKLNVQIRCYDDDGKQFSYIYYNKNSITIIMALKMLIYNYENVLNVF